MGREGPRSAHARGVVPAELFGSRVPLRSGVLECVGGGRVRVFGFSAPLCICFAEPPASTLWSDASGNAFGGCFLGPEPGLAVWWRFHFGDDMRAVASDDPWLKRSVD